MTMRTIRTSAGDFNLRFASEFEDTRSEIVRRIANRLGYPSGRSSNASGSWSHWELAMGWPDANGGLRVAREITVFI